MRTSVDGIPCEVSFSRVTWEQRIRQSSRVRPTGAEMRQRYRAPGVQGYGGTGDTGPERVLCALCQGHKLLCHATCHHTYLVPLQRTGIALTGMHAAARPTDHVAAHSFANCLVVVGVMVSNQCYGATEGGTVDHPCEDSLSTRTLRRRRSLNIVVLMNESIAFLQEKKSLLCTFRVPRVFVGVVPHIDIEQRQH